MWGASEEEESRALGGSNFLHTKGVYQTLDSWPFETTTFEFATKDEAIVDAPWVRLCISVYIYHSEQEIIHIHTSRGDSTIAHSVAMVS